MRGMKLRMTRETKKLFRVRRGPGPMALVLPLLVIALVVSCVVYDNSRIVVDEVQFSMPALPRDMEGTGVLLLSDIRDHTFGEDAEGLSRALKGLDYDFVVMTGDVTGTDGSTDGFYQALEYFAAQGRDVYFITGDNDPPATGFRADGSFGLSDWVLGAQERGAVYLDVPVCIGGAEPSLWLMPASALVLDTQSSLDSLDARLADDSLDDATVQSILYRRERYQAFADAMAERKYNDLTIMLTHMPCLDKSLQTQSATDLFGQADLILAGHHLGGQICLPFFGALKVDNEQLPRGGWLPESRYLSGLNEVNATQQYISTGLGTAWKGLLNFRLWNPPQISLITLTRNVET